MKWGRISAKILFWMAALSLAGQLLMETNVATVGFTVLLMVPYLYLKYREGRAAADPGGE